MDAECWELITEYDEECLWFVSQIGRLESENEKLEESIQKLIKETGSRKVIFYNRNQSTHVVQERFWLFNRYPIPINGLLLLLYCIASSPILRPVESRYYLQKNIVTDPWFN